jgi:hypothetical protein
MFNMFMCLKDGGRERDRTLNILRKRREMKEMRWKKESAVIFETQDKEKERQV